MSMAFSDNPEARGMVSQCPVVIRMYPKANEHNAKLVEFIHKHGDKQNKETNVKTTIMTDWMLLNDGNEPILRELCQYIQREAMRHSPAWHVGGEPIHMNLYNVWGAVYEKDDYSITHDHWPAIWSFCYYAKADAKSAPLVFTDNGLEIKPIEGMFILFPGWVRHHVPQQAGAGSRVIVAGNFSPEAQADLLRM